MGNNTFFFSISEGNSCQKNLSKCIKRFIWVKWPLVDFPPEGEGTSQAVDISLRTEARRQKGMWLKGEFSGEKICGQSSGEFSRAHGQRKY